MSAYIMGEEGAPARAPAGSIDWCTPLDITDGTAEVFGHPIGTDPCANPGSIPRVKALVNLTLPRNNGLVDPWRQPLPEPGMFTDSGFINPPFGTYYMHCDSKEILVPKEFKKLVEERAEKAVLQDSQESGSLNSLKSKALKAAKAKARKDLLAEGWKRYSIVDWIKKCAAEAAGGMDLVYLGPASVDTAGWQKIIYPTAAAVCYLRGRLKFELVDFQTLKVVSTGNSAPMPCALVLWTKKPELVERFARVFCEGKKPRGTLHLLPGLTDALAPQKPGCPLDRSV